MEQLLRIVHELQQENQQLWEEIDRFNGLPQCPRRLTKASALNDANAKAPISLQAEETTDLEVPKTFEYPSERRTFFKHAEKARRILGWHL